MQFVSFQDIRTLVDVFNRQTNSRHDPMADEALARMGRGHGEKGRKINVCTVDMVVVQLLGTAYGRPRQDVVTSKAEP